MGLIIKDGNHHLADEKLLSITFSVWHDLMSNLVDEYTECETQ